MNKDGYVMVKVRRFSDKHYSTSCWKPKHRVIWEEANNQKLSCNTVVVFADGNRQNFDPDNLVAIPKSEWSIICREGLNYSNRETLLAAVDIAKLKHGIRDARCRDRNCRSCGCEFKPRFPSQRTCDECLKRERS